MVWYRISLAVTSRARVLGAIAAVSLPACEDRAAVPGNDLSADDGHAGATTTPGAVAATGSSPGGVGSGAGNAGVDGPAAGGPSTTGGEGHEASGGTSAGRGGTGSAGAAAGASNAGGAPDEAGAGNAMGGIAGVTTAAGSWTAPTRTTAASAHCKTPA